MQVLQNKGTLSGTKGYNGPLLYGTLRMEFFCFLIAVAITIEWLINFVFEDKEVSCICSCLIFMLTASSTKLLHC